NPAVGFTLGQFANRPIHRKISRVKDGDVGVVAAYLSNGTTVETYESAWDSIHDNGYIFFRKFANKSGYYFSGDPACCPVTSDYASLARGGVMDKIQRIAVEVMTEELEDDLEVDESGYPSPAVLKGYQQIVLNALTERMKG